MTRTAYIVCHVFIGVVFSFACDPVYRTLQLVEVQVFDPRNGVGLASVTVEAMREYHDRGYSELSDAERNKRWFNPRPLQRCATNEEGYASFDADIWTICGGIFPGGFPGFDPEIDRVTGQPYLFRVSKGAFQEMLAVRIKPGVTKIGHNFAITVLSIGEPRLAAIGNSSSVSDAAAR